jgi:hypothetical protein
MRPKVSAPRFAVNSYSTPHNTIYQDIEQVAAIGGAAVGLWEGKFSDGDDAQIADCLQRHNLAAAFCVPRMHAILEIPFDRSGTPTDPRKRTALICESIQRTRWPAPLTGSG